MLFVWNYFCELQGREPLRYDEIKAWSELTGRHVTPWEVETIKALDRIMWETLAENGNNRASSHPG